MNLESVKIVLEIIALSATIIGIPVYIYIYYKEKKRERLDREYGTYNALDDKYIDFLRLCIDNIDLNIYLLDNEITKNLNEQQKIRQYIIFEILVCIFERAFLMYKGHSDKIRRNQWVGWNSYIEDWLNNESFRKAWRNFIGNQYDTDFISYMNIICEGKKEMDSILNNFYSENNGNHTEKKQ